MISVLILTLNEEVNLPSCLESVNWSDDIIVFDSYSTDRTAEIAKAAGVRVFQRRFDNFAAQRNAALTEVDYKYPWVLMVDADECTPLDLAEEMKKVVGNPSVEEVMFRMRRKDYLYGAWLRQSNCYPTWFGRLVRPEKIRVERSVNEEYIANGKVGLLKGNLIHHSYNAGFHAWLVTQNHHSSMEAEKIVTDVASEPVRLVRILSRDPVERRKTMKQIAFRLPGRPLIVMFYLYILRFGFIEGKAGFTHCVLRAFYEYILDLKVKELQRRKKGLSI